MSRQLGVSTATVSNAFNRPDQLSQALRERILRESAELGYHGPNLAARLLRKGQSDVIGVMLADSLSYGLSDPVANQLLQGIADVLVEREKQLLLLSSGLEGPSQSSAESLPDGFIFYGAPRGSSFDKIVRSGKPCVAVDFSQVVIASVNIDNYASAKKVALHAIEQVSAPRIAILGMRIIHSDRVCRLVKTDLQEDSQEIAWQRLQGYLDAAVDKGANIPFEQIWHVPINTAEMSEVAAREALSQAQRPNIILCMSDLIALSVLRVAESLGIKVPEQLCVVGFG